ncbi:hypothetical protein M569_10641 [Genlisea aurea]|uniref:Uncharacterized protein n=1 Tax=Genlisea aurea TaxID=192259 RepID=S8DW32_9LAMI|nr:hypothetical protein M569_10641 [Genlisea aurea]
MNQSWQPQQTKKQQRVDPITTASRIERILNRKTSTKFKLNLNFHHLSPADPLSFHRRTPPLPPLNKYLLNILFLSFERFFSMYYSSRFRRQTLRRFLVFCTPARPGLSRI